MRATLASALSRDNVNERFVRPYRPNFLYQPVPERQHEGRIAIRAIAAPVPSSVRRTDYQAPSPRGKTGRFVHAPRFMKRDWVLLVVPGWQRQQRRRLYPEDAAALLSFHQRWVLGLLDQRPGVAAARRPGCQHARSPRCTGASSVWGWEHVSRSMPRRLVRAEGRGAPSGILLRRWNANAGSARFWLVHCRTRPEHPA